MIYNIFIYTFIQSSSNMPPKRRLLVELNNLKQSPPPGISIHKADGLDQWLIDIVVLDNNPLYEDQTYRLEFTFSNSYPLDSPQVRFVKTSQTPTVPIHPHIYSNGHICLDLLGSGWSPIQTVGSICISLQSMLTGNDRNERPPDDDRYVKHAPKNPKDAR